MATSARHRLAELMEERRRYLRLRWQDVAESGHVSLKALYDARTGTAGIASLTQRGIEIGLQWPSGTVQRILDGGEAEAGELVTGPAAGEPVPEPPSAVMSAASAAVSALLAPVIEEVEAEVRRARMRRPSATGRDIFSDELERQLFDLDDDPATEPDRISFIAFTRMKSRQAQEAPGRPRDVQ